MNTNNGWLDIASAPKDGSRVLLWNRHFDAPCSGQFYGFGDWRMDGNLPPFVYQPTHWMPLPAAPGSPTEQPTYTVTVDPDPRGVSVGVYQGSSCVYHGVHEVPAPAAGDARAWQGLTDAERDGYVGELVDYGTDFVAPLYSVVESIEKRLREKNAASQQGGDSE